MGKINWGRVILGGLLAGVVINVFEFVLHGVILEEQWEAAMAALGRTMEESAGMMAIYIILGFLIGIFAVWLYAAVRPRFGPGPKTAACAGFAAWFGAYLLPTLGYMPMGLFPNDLMLIAVAVGLVEVIVATVVGAWPYKE